MNEYKRGEEAFLKAYGRYDIVLEKGDGVYLLVMDIIHMLRY